jgi:hypothetical protein
MNLFWSAVMAGTANPRTVFTLTLSSALLFATAAMAEDQGFRVDPSSGQCMNDRGDLGLNPKYVGECGELAGADLANAELQGVNLRGADLRGANLTGAYLNGADLRGAVLSGANLTGAYLYKADLRGSTLRQTRFLSTHLSGADLTGADLRGAQMLTKDLYRVSMKDVFLDEETAFIPGQFELAAVGARP